MPPSCPSPPWTRPERLQLLALGLLAVALRWVHVWGMSASPFFDAPQMDPGFHVEWARAFARGETFLEGPYFRAPLYPWLLGIEQALFGEGLLLPRLFQGLLGGATTVLTYLLARRSFGLLAARVAGLLAATSWVLIYFDGELLIPTLYVPLLLLGLLLAMGLGELEPGRARWRRAALTGLAFGVAALARPNVLLFLPLLGLWVWLAARPRDLRAALLLTLGTLAPILPVTVRNRVVGGEWVLISSQAGVNLWIGNNPASDGSTAIVPGTPGGWWEGFHGARDQARREAGRDLSDAEISQHYSRKAWAWAVEHPGDFLGHLAWKLRLFWLDHELGNNQEIRFFARRFNPLSRLSVPFSLLAGLGLVGLVLALRGSARRTLPLWGFFGMYMGSVVLFFVCSRFRVPVLPVLMVLGGHAVERGWHVWRQGRRAPLALGLAAVCAVALMTRLKPDALVAGDANGFGQLGLAAHQAGDATQAVELFEQGLAADPDHRYLRGWMARALRDAGDLPRALRLLEETLQDYPDQPEALGLWLDLAVEAERFEEARQRAEQALVRQPGLTEARYHLGRAQLALGQPQQALESFTQVERQDPRDWRAPYARGVVLRGLGQEAAAQAAFELAAARGAPAELP